MVLNTIGAAAETASWLGRVDALAAELDASTQFQLHGVWSFYHLHQGDPAAALQRARSAQDLQRHAHIDNEWAHALPNMLVQAQQWLGDLEAAEAEVRALRAPAAPPVAAEVRAPGFASYLQVLRGELAQAESLAVQALSAADRLGLPPRNFGRAEPELTLAVIQIEHNRLDDAQSQLDRVMQIAEGGRRPPIEFLVHLQQARLAALRGDEQAAADSLHHADRVFSDPKPPVLAHLDHVAARLALDRNDPQTVAALWARMPEAPATDLLEARLRLTEGRPAAAESALARVARTGPRRTQVERGLLSALAKRQTDVDAALDALETALLAAQPAGFLMTIVGEGPRLWSLLDSLPARPEIADYVGQLLQTARGLVPPPRPVTSQGLAAPLSERELTVLRHLASRLDSTEIAGALYLSVNTVRTHVKAIYRKLGVNSRAEALRRARALALIRSLD
jgi:LuxR family maltose regulon positive regulatory protein